MKRIDVIRPTLRPFPVQPWEHVEMLTCNGRLYARSHPGYISNFYAAAGLLERLSKPGRLEAVTQFLNQLDELER